MAAHIGSLQDGPPRQPLGEDFLNLCLIRREDPLLLELSTLASLHFHIVAEGIAFQVFGLQAGQLCPTDSQGLLEVDGAGITAGSFLLPAPVSSGLLAAPGDCRRVSGRFCYLSHVQPAALRERGQIGVDGISRLPLRPEVIGVFLQDLPRLLPHLGGSKPFGLSCRSQPQKEALDSSPVCPDTILIGQALEGLHLYLVFQTHFARFILSSHGYHLFVLDSFFLFWFSGWSACSTSDAIADSAAESAADEPHRQS